MTERHPFAGYRGAQRRDRLALEVGQRDGFSCFLCGCSLYPGRKAHNARVLEHLEPWKLSPAKAYDPDNLRLCCKLCHDTTCARIEAAHPNDPVMILQAKLRVTEEW